MASVNSWIVSSRLVSKRLLEFLEDVEVFIDDVVDNVADTGEDDVMETF